MDTKNHGLNLGGNCPSCGYCPHCGRRNAAPAPFWSPPYWYTYPYTPTPVWYSDTTGNNFTLNGNGGNGG